VNRKEITQLVSGTTMLLVGFVIAVSNISMSDTQREIASLKNREVTLESTPWELSEKELETINKIADSLAEQI
jgi:hypothetical protein